jgi:hypothetical protein
MIAPFAVAGAALSLAVGPGPVDTAVHTNGYTVHVRMAPNAPLRAGTLSLALSKGGKPVAEARVRASARMLDMNMGSFALTLRESRPGIYSAPDPAVGMTGRWGWRIAIRPRGAPSFVIVLVDRVGG